ncbi:MAG: class I SAM-dependent methyltransferase [Bryobacteraceae bacterium]|nr:class I SAM-dependent methyltransferase [Bryobacteraceae bacterium]
MTESIEERTILGLCGSLSGRRVLDIGCGDGTYALRVSQEGAFAVGIDISRSMLRAARTRAAAQPSHGRWCQASIAALPFAANSFDVVLAVTVLCFHRDPDSAIREAARVLRPGGSPVIGELGKYSSWSVSRRVRGWLGSRTWRSARFWSMRGLQRATESAGLLVDGTQGCVYYPPVAFLAEILRPFEPVLSRLGQLGAAFLTVKARKP